MSDVQTNMEDGIQMATSALSRNKGYSRDEHRSRLDAELRVPESRALFTQDVLGSKKSVMSLACALYDQRYGRDPHFHVHQPLTSANEPMFQPIDPEEQEEQAERERRQLAAQGIVIQMMAQLSVPERDFVSVRLVIVQPGSVMTREQHRLSLRDKNGNILTKGAYRTRWYRICRKLRNLYEKLCATRGRDELGLMDTDFDQRDN